MVTGVPYIASRQASAYQASARTMMARRGARRRLKRLAKAPRFPIGGSIASRSGIEAPLSPIPHIGRSVSMLVPASAARAGLPGHVMTLPVPMVTGAPLPIPFNGPSVSTLVPASAARAGLPGHVTTLPVPMVTGVSPVGMLSSAALPNPLARCIAQWRACAPSRWVLRTIQKGYRLQFSMKPPVSSRVVFTRASGAAAVTLREEICTLLSKGAIKEISLEQRGLGFYSTYFLVKKKGGGVRPILNLKGLNKFLTVFKFRMLTTASLLRTIRQGEWWSSVDLKDAYFHIPIYPPHRKFLRFGFEGRVYEYTVLPFGLALSPRVFVKCTQAAIAPLRRLGIRLSTYIDDWLIHGESRQEVSRHTAVVVSHLESLGFNINRQKSVLVPSQQTTFIGISLDSVTLMARLSQDRINSFLACVQSFRAGRQVQYKLCMQATGLMASAIHLIRLGRLHMRPFQRWVRSLRIPPTQGKRMVQVPQGAVDTLRPWSNAAFLSQGVRVGAVISRKVITTDASLKGWGALHEGRAASGVWAPGLQGAHINYLELMAVFLAVKHFEVFIRGCHVLIRTDNTATMCYVNKQGGLASLTLDKLACELTHWCDARLASLRAIHVPGLQNSGADLLSRGGYRYADWSLHPAVARGIWTRFGRPQVDLFASEENAKCSRFFSMKGASPLGLDALAHSWPDELLYAFPPLNLILPTLERIRLHGLSLLLVAPAWGAWRSEIQPLLYDNPWPLPLRRDLLRQAGDEIFHPNPQDLDLWVWPVRGRP